MKALCSATDVETRLGRELTDTEAELVDPGMIQEASVKVLAAMRKPEDFYDDRDVPLTVTVVTSRSVARAVQQAGSGIMPGTQQTSGVAGPFSGQTTFVTGASIGSPWLSAQDKADLANVYGDNRAFGMDRLATVGNGHDVACSLNFGATYCSCGADIAGTPIYGV